MGWNDHYDDELQERVDELVAEGELEKGTPAYGVAQQVIFHGYESLSPRQRYVYDKRVVPLLRDLSEQHEINSRNNNALP